MAETISDMADPVPALVEKYVDDVAAPERCGFVLPDGQVVEVKNICHEPADGFDISGEDLLEYEDRAAGSWHTHTGKDCNLTREDLLSFLNWPTLKHYIVGSDGVAVYVVEKGNVLRAATYSSSRRAEEHPSGAD